MSALKSFLVITLISIGCYYVFAILIDRLLPYNDNHHVLAVGQFQGIIVPQQVPVDKLSPLLPSDIELVTDKIEDNTFTVLYGFGRQHKLGPVFGGIQLTYLESFVVVPFVRFKPEYQERHGVNMTFTFIPKLYLDNTYGILMGKMYGLAKFRGNLSWSEEDSGSHYHIWNSDDNTNILDVQWKPLTSWKTSKEFPHSKRYIEGALTLPLIGESGLGVYLSCFFDWNFQEAAIRGVAGKLSFQQSYTGDLPTGDFEFQGLDTDYTGAYQLITNWTLSLPYLGKYM